MRASLRFFLAASLAAFLAPAHAALNVLATVPEWGALVQEIGGDKVKVYTATNALMDPHHVEAKPSLIARARSADLVVATGAELEVGWLPLVLQQSGNSRVQPGTAGYFEAASTVNLLGKPTRLDRAEGDVHPQGDPHIQTDPRNIARVAAALVERMAQLDPADAAAFRANYQQFSQKWNAAIARWTQQAAPLKGTPIVVQHKGFTYLESWLGLKEVAALEPKPGMEPTTSHLAQVLETLKGSPAKMIVRAAYLSDRPSQWLSERAHIPVVTLPFTVGGDDQSKDLFSYFDDTVALLLKANS
jgi:zinc/manganese transport system substrate-binding protein